MFENMSLEELNKVVEEATKRRDEMMATYRNLAKADLKMAWEKFRSLNKEGLEWCVSHECNECGHEDDAWFDLFNEIDSWLRR